jgi:hypothetical protein
MAESDLIQGILPGNGLVGVFAYAHPFEIDDQPVGVPDYLRQMLAHFALARYDNLLAAIFERDPRNLAVDGGPCRGANHREYQAAELK